MLIFLDDVKDYVFTKNQYTKVTPDSPMFAIDCEMVSLW